MIFSPPSLLVNDVTSRHHAGRLNNRNERARGRVHFSALSSSSPGAHTRPCVYRRTAPAPFTGCVYRQDHLRGVCVCVEMGEESNFFESITVHGYTSTGRPDFAKARRSFCFLFPIDCYGMRRDRYLQIVRIGTNVTDRV